MNEQKPGDFTFDQLQTEHGPWAARNFGVRPSWMPALGIVEEAGELAHAELSSATPEQADVRSALAVAMYAGRFAHAVLKTAQGIRGTRQQHEDAAMEALSRLLAVALTYVTRIGRDHEFGARVNALANTRMYEPDRTAEDCADALADVTIFGSDYASAKGFNYGQLVEQTWAKVRTRDWKTDPQHGVTGGSAEQARP